MQIKLAVYIITRKMSKLSLRYTILLQFKFHNSPSPQKSKNKNKNLLKLHGSGTHKTFTTYVRQPKNLSYLK